MTIRQHTIDTPYMVGPVHCYTTEIGSEIVLFDTGPPTKRAQKYFQENIDFDRLGYIFITHCHIDHCGLATWLVEQSDAKVYLPYRDSLKIRSHQERLQDMYSLLKGIGFSGTYLELLHHSLSDGNVFPPYPKDFNVVEDGVPQHLGLDFLACPGHSQSDLVYYTKSWAVTGDTLLRGVFQSPLLDVDLETGKRFNNYHAYCTTLTKLASLQEKMICPGHRVNVDSVDATLLFYISKMLKRVMSLNGIAEQENVAKIIEQMFGDSIKNPFHVYLKASEIMFMQDFLAQPEYLKESLEAIGLFDAVVDLYERATPKENNL